MKKLMKIVSLLLVLTLSVTSFPIDVLAQDNTVNEISTNDCSTNTYIGNGYKVEFKVSNQWDGAFNGELIITNTSNKSLENWTLKYDFNHEITNIWNAKIISHENNTYTIKNLGWNQDIQPGSSISIGFTANWSDEIVSPENYSMLITSKELNTDDFTIEFKVTSDWGQAFNGEIIITNNRKETIEDWSLEFDFEGNIESFWTAEILEHTGNHYIIKNAGYNANILAGESISLGFNGNPGNLNSEPSEYKLIEITELSDDINIDSDEDGIYDYLEDYIGTDKYNKDSDGDGLDDYQEAVILNTDPLKKDSDNNGIEDGFEDCDKDGLVNLKEFEIGSDPTNVDTDGDGINDGDEVNKYGSNPTLLDSDSDNLDDNNELKFGTDIMNPDTNGNGILDGDEIYEMSYNVGEDENKDENVEPSLDMTLSAGKVDTVKIEKIDSEKDYLLSNKIPGYIGCAYDLSMDGEFESAKLTFTYDEKFNLIEGFTPRIYYFDEENQYLDELENQSVEGNSISVTLEHFSKYILVDKNQFDKAVSNKVKSPNGSDSNVECVDVAFTVDISASMDWNDPSWVRKSVLTQFVDTFENEDRGALITFTKVANKVSDFTSDKTKLINKIDSLKNDSGYNSYSGTDGSAGLNEAKDVFENSKRSSNKYLVLLTDGEDTQTSYSYDTYIDYAVENDITTYTIGLGDSIDTTLLRKIANTTGGKYFNAAQSNDLFKTFSEIKQDTIDYKTDSNNDGISDYYTKRIYDGTLTLGTGVSLKGIILSKKADYDGDGILNGDEIAIYEYKDRIYIKVFSDPASKDSDHDGLLDGEERTVNGKKVLPKDPDPLKINGPEGIWEAQYEQELSGNIPHKLGDSYKLDWSWKDIAASVGSKLLNFKLDDKKIALHSQVETWQKIGGYNDLYDIIFRVGTNGNMAKEKFLFKDDENKEYVLWTWRGDYLNLGSGSEIGIYEKPIDVPLIGSKHWKAADFTLPMTLNLYNYYDKDDIENIFCWAPDEEQWWITGFNPDFGNHKVDDMVSLGTIDFSGHEDMFTSLKENVCKNDKLKDYMIFDEDGHTIWLIWWRK